MLERDASPHSHYCAWHWSSAKELRADAFVQFGMHGTHEWLPGSFLGSSPFCWLCSILNAYIYAAFNPSQSALAIRPVSATTTAHRFPALGRASTVWQY